MKLNAAILAVRYRAGLEAFLRRGQAPSCGSARRLGLQSAAFGVSAVKLANLHEKILVAQILPRCRPALRSEYVKRAGVFLAAAITKTKRPDDRGAGSSLTKAIETLSQRNIELAASNRELNLEVARRRASEAALKDSQEDNARSMEQSRMLQGQMRALSRQLLSAQEDERRRISRELHDVIAQTLTGINLRLSAFAGETAGASKSLQRNIAMTQRMVERSLAVVHRFARELRPTALDDLGLIPALHSFLKGFTARTGIHASLSAFAAVEKLDIARRTTLFRVAQEALANVARHSGASCVQVTIQLAPRLVIMRIVDDGKSFDLEAAPRGKRRQRLGLLGMRERVEMIGGVFAIDATPGRGVTISARIPRQKVPAQL